jgi:hypothetical protein
MEDGKLAPDPWSLADRWDELEAKYRANKYDGMAAPDAILHSPGASHLILTAPHSLNHFRGERFKLADRWTGGLCQILGSSLRVTTLIPIGRISSWDTWESRNDAFKVTLDKAVTSGSLVVDLHGMSDTYGIDVCIGTGHDPRSLTKQAATMLAQELPNYRVSMNDPFTATPSFAVVSYVQGRLNANALQLEIAARLRNPVENPEQAGRFALDLTRAFRVIQGTRVGR